MIGIDMPRKSPAYARALSHAAALFMDHGRDALTWDQSKMLEDVGLTNLRHEFSRRERIRHVQGRARWFALLIKNGHVSPTPFSQSTAILSLEAQFAYERYKEDTTPKGLGRRAWHFTRCWGWIIAVSASVITSLCIMIYNLLKE